MSDTASQELQRRSWQRIVRELRAKHPPASAFNKWMRDAGLYGCDGATANDTWHSVAAEDGYGK